MCIITAEPVTQTQLKKNGVFRNYCERLAIKTLSYKLQFIFILPGHSVNMFCKTCWINRETGSFVCESLNRENNLLYL